MAVAIQERLAEQAVLTPDCPLPLFSIDDAREYVHEFIGRRDIAQAFSAARALTQSRRLGVNLADEDLEFYDEIMDRTGFGSEFRSNDLCTVLRNGLVVPHYNAEQLRRHPECVGQQRGFHLRWTSEGQLFDTVVLDQGPYLEMPTAEQEDMVSKFGIRRDDDLVRSFSKSREIGHWFGREAAWTGVLGYVTGYGVFLQQEGPVSYREVGMAELRIVWRRENSEGSEPFGGKDQPLLKDLI